MHTITKIPNNPLNITILAFLTTKVLIVPVLLIGALVFKNYNFMENYIQTIFQTL